MLHSFCLFHKKRNGTANGMRNVYCIGVGFSRRSTMPDTTKNRSLPRGETNRTVKTCGNKVLPDVPAQRGRAVKANMATGQELLQKHWIRWSVEVVSLSPLFSRAPCFSVVLNTVQAFGLFTFKVYNQSLGGHGIRWLLHSILCHELCVAGTDGVVSVCP